ncbi:hypothetical protein AALA83_02045 [Oscillospiraceae bacterium 44-5]
MAISLTFELSMTLDTDHFQRIFTTKVGYLKELDNEYVDPSLAEKGITVIYRDSRYKKRIRLLVNTSLVVADSSNTDKLIRKLGKRIDEYFDHKYGLDDFTLSSLTLTQDINVGSRAKVSDYLKVLQRVGKVKGFSPISYDCFDEKASFCLSGNSNDTDFLLYDLEAATVGQLRNADAGRKQLQAASMQTKGILRAEVKLTKPKAIREYTNVADTSGQVSKLIKASTDAFLNTFARLVPFGDFYKMDAAVEIVRSEVTDSAMRRKMLRLLSLIPDKKSLHLAQKALNCRDVEKVMESFTKIHLSPVTIAKRHEIKHLDNIYSYFLK